uniref:Toll-like receptor 2 n=1 Tax=Sillago sinica TaxID=907714 RepID=A0A5J6SCN1_9TELE|nr:toll-like receptor 2-1 [Sillago sinica]
MAIQTFLMFFLLAHHSLSLSRSQCHSCEQASCDCSRQNLRRVPGATSEFVIELDLSFNRLRTVMKNDFVAYAGLKSLIMNNNMIKTIQERAFVPLTHLEKLDLSFNSLDTLSAEWFETLYSLLHLNLLGNQYKTLGQGNLFQPLKRLKTLHFGGVYLYSIRLGDFSGLRALEEVTFDGQNLKAYAEGSFRQIGPIKNVTLGLNVPFQTNQALVIAVLSDVVHPDTTLTFTNTFFFRQYQLSPFKLVYSGGTTSVSLKNINITTEAGVALLNILSGTNITKVAFEDVKFLFGDFSDFTCPTMNHLEEIFLKNIEIPMFYGFPGVFGFKCVLKALRRVSVLNSRLFAIPCQSPDDLSQLEYMDISDNMLSDLTLSQMCNGKGSLLNLQTINISRNHLQKIDSWRFRNLDKLNSIDMSGNMLNTMPETCYWPPGLRFLNLSSTHLRKVTTCLPETLQILDVSDNGLTEFNIELPFLTELYISGNKLSFLPEGVLYPRLTSLFIQNNNLQTLSNKTVNDFSNLMSLQAGSNTYICSCDFVAFMSNDFTDHQVTIKDMDKSYICDSPDTMRGKTVLEARLSVFECHTAVAFSFLCLGILAVFLLIAGLCHKFNVAWYMRMTMAWLRAKKKPKLKRGELKYDAFVSYSDMDSGWVEAHLIPALEEAEPPLQLCLHKRDFVPGGWILDNIMDAIEKSHRTLFILSQHFVNSEWCKYELDYTHFRLFDHNDDTVVLILLEPINKDTIPKKFCKLRRVMNSRTYLEWPDNDNQVPMFWQSLRTAIRRPEADDDGNDIHETVNL